MRIHGIQIGGLSIGLSYTTFLIDALLMAVPAIFMIFFDRRQFTLREMGFPKTENFFGSTVITGKIFLTLVFFSVILSMAFTSAGANDLEPVKKVAQTFAAASPFTLAYFFVVRVFAEEFFFRAFLVPRIGVLGSSALFGLAHFSYGSGAEVIGSVALGIILAVAYRQYGKILPNFVAHMLYNFIAVISLVSA